MRTFAEAVKRAFTGDAGRRASKMEIAAMDVMPETKTRSTGIATPNVMKGDGVLVRPTPITAGEETEIWYGGLLAKSGARRVMLHWGVGPGAWQNVRDVSMRETSTGVWNCTIQAAYGGRLEFCFHDGAGHWDNNSGKNWSYTIHNGLIQ